MVVRPQDIERLVEEDTLKLVRILEKFIDRSLRKEYRPKNHNYAIVFLPYSRAELDSREAIDKVLGLYEGCGWRVYYSEPSNPTPDKKSSLSFRVMPDLKSIDKSQINPTLFYDKSIDTINFSWRPRQVLERTGVKIVGDLIKLTELELLSYKNFGETSLQEIKEKLAEMGLRLRKED